MRREPLPSTLAGGVGPVSPQQLQRTLRRTFGIAQLREGQQQVIDRVLRGQDTLAVMPTGAGKSLCYQLPAVLMPGTTLVVSPLIALMKDQCEALLARGIAAVELNSALDAARTHAAEDAIHSGRARIVLTTPERLAEPGFVQGLPPVSLLVVDEAHCISQWGHDFRPAFLEIAPAIKALGRPGVLALTATATPEVTADILQQLGMAAGDVVNTGVYRATLDLAVEHVEDEAQKMARTLALVQQTPGAGIVYTATVKAAQAVCAALAGQDGSVALYHGRLGAAQRQSAQEAFMSGERRVMVATNAFGLGINKADIRFVLHHQMPASLDAYYQEAGRAGRDGQQAQCTLLFHKRDKSLQQFFMAGRYPDAADVQALYHALARHVAAHGKAAPALARLGAPLQLPQARLQVAASLLRRHRVVAQDGDGGLMLRRLGMADEELAQLAQDYQRRRAQDQATLERMVFYAQTGQCRWQLILQNFEEPLAFRRCGHCDNCRRIARHEAALAQAEPEEAAPAQPAPRFAPGEPVRARRYGPGQVVSLEAGNVTVAFPDGTERCFLADYVRPLGRTGRHQAGSRASTSGRAKRSSIR